MPDGIKNRNVGWSVLALVGAIMALSITQVRAAVPATVVGSGITVSPAYVTAQVGSKQPQATASVGVKNNFDVPITVTAVLNGFDIRNNALLPTSQSVTTLADIVTFTPAEITIPPKSSKNIAITVTDKPSLPPGGHYLSLLITQTTTESNGDNPQLALRPAVSATVYVIKEDGAVRSLTAKRLLLNNAIFSVPSAADITFFNDGNVVSVPRGIVTISKNGNAKIFSQSVVNSESAPIYPKQTATLRSTFLKLEKPAIPGRFTATLTYRPDGQDRTKTLVATVWYVPISFLFGLLILITVLSLLARPKVRKSVVKKIRIIRQKKPKPFVMPDVKKGDVIPAVKTDDSPTKIRKIDIQ